MWDSCLKYGKIADLVTSLNYNSTRGRGTARPYSDLTTKTLKHRKDFIKNVLEERDPPATFPVIFDDPDAQLCASKFLEENVTLFEGASPMLDSKLAYPTDSGEIINVLAKIICTQEVMYHRNQLHVEARKVNKEDTIAVATPVMDDEPVGQTSISPPSKAKQTSEEQMHEFEKNILPINIQINLNVAYPLKPEPPFTENQWVFGNGSYWPEELQSFTFRWLHEHKAYQIHHSSDHVRNFVAALKKQIGLPPVLTSDQETKIYNKTHKYLTNWIRTWSQCGLLIQKGDVIVRHRDLDKALSIRRSDYIAVVQNGHLEGPGMLTPAKSRTPASLKRSVDSVDDVKSDALETKRVKSGLEAQPEFLVFDDYTEPRPAPVARRSFGAPPVHAPQPSSSPPYQHHMQQKSDITAHSAADPSNSIDPPMSTNSPFEALRSAPGHQLPSRNGSPAIPSKTTTPTPSSIESTMTTDTNGHALPFRYIPPLPPGNNAARHFIENKSIFSQSLIPQRTTTSEPTQAQSQNDVSRRVSAPFTSSVLPASVEQTSLPTPSPQPQTPATPDVRPVQVKPSPPTLFLVVEKAEGALNTEHPLSESDLRNSALLEFFDKVSSRRQNPEQSIVRLRLVQRWGAKISFLVDRSMTEDQWKQVRGDIRKNFMFQSEKKLGKTRFEVYIICEVDGESSEDDEED